MKLHTTTILTLLNQKFKIVPLADLILFPEGNTPWGDGVEKILNLLLVIDIKIKD